jgi:molybdopterin synthase catalytic subunit
MRVRVKFFAAAREIVGQGEVALDLKEGSTVSDLMEHFFSRYPRLKGMAGSLLLAVNREFSELTTQLREGDEVGVIPPVSGGSHVEITEKPLSVETLVQQVTRNTCGAVATFIGVVREFSRGRQVSYLEYEAYPEMAIAKMRQIAEEIRQKWEIERVAIHHRIGRLGIGELSVVIAVSAPHRRQALEACAYAIERLKQIVPIWKKEVAPDGSSWVGMGS